MLEHSVSGGGAGRRVPDAPIPSSRFRTPRWHPRATTATGVVPGRRLSHTMDPSRRAPVLASPAPVTIVAPNCAEAGAWTTALVVRGPDRGEALAVKRGLDALFILRDNDRSARGVGVGRLFFKERDSPQGTLHHPELPPIFAKHVARARDRLHGLHAGKGGKIPPILTFRVF